MVSINSRFQLEAEKIGKHVVFQVTVYEKNTRNKTILFAETQCSDPYQFIVQFIVRDCPDFDTLLSRFLEQLDYRGYIPVRYRKKNSEKWDQWIAIPPHPSTGDMKSHS